MPSPYKTKCFDYNKIGCKSRIDCVDRCNVELTVKHCNGSLPSRTIIDRHNDKNIFNDICKDNYTEFCEQKYKSLDCINEYYKIILKADKKFKEMIRNNSSEKSLNTFFSFTDQKKKADINLLSQIHIYFNTEPDTIYTHSPHQYPIEFICLIEGVISLWTGFSVVSIYAYGKRVFNRKQNKVEQIDHDNVGVNNYNQIHNHFHNHFYNQKHFVFINNKMNDKISSIKKLRKIVKK